MTCGASRFTLLTMPVEDYPNLPVDAADVTGTVDGDELTHAVAQVSVAASRDDTLPLLTGVRVEIEGEKRHAPGDRPLPARAARADVEAVDARTSRRVALVRARTLLRRREVARQRRLGDRRAVARAPAST